MDLFTGQILTATRVVAFSSRPLLGVNTVDVFLDLGRGLVTFGPRDGAGFVPEVTISLGEVVRARHWTGFALPGDEGWPIYIYIRISGVCDGQLKDRQKIVRGKNDS